MLSGHSRKAQVQFLLDQIEVTAYSVDGLAEGVTIWVTDESARPRAMSNALPCRKLQMGSGEGGKVSSDLEGLHFQKTHKVSSHYNDARDSLMVPGRPF